MGRHEVPTFVETTRRRWRRGFQLVEISLGEIAGKILADERQRLRQVGGTHEVFVHAAGGLAAFGDGPDNEGLAAAHVARAENSRDAGHGVLVGKHIASWVKFETELFDHAAFLRAKEAKGQQHEVGFHFKLRAWHL